MNLTSILQTLLTATIPAILSYMVSNKSSKVKLKEIEKSYELQIKELESINEKLKLEHNHKLELIKLQSQVNKDETINNALASVMPDVFSKVVTGEIDINQIKRLSNKIKN